MCIFPTMLPTGNTGTWVVVIYKATHFLAFQYLLCIMLV